MPLNKLLYENPGSIPRQNLRKMLPKLRRNLVCMLDGVGRPMDREGIHNQTLGEMGNFVTYKFAQPSTLPLREMMPSPERLDTFGSPFRRKSTGFVADEVFVEDVSLPGGSSPLSAVLSPTAADRRRRATTSRSGRDKGTALYEPVIFYWFVSIGPLPAYITFSNWRKLSRSCSTASTSPQRDDFTPCACKICRFAVVIVKPFLAPIHNGDMNHLISSSSPSPPLTDNWRGDLSDQRRPKQASIFEDEESFDINRQIVRDLIDVIKKPALGNFRFRVGCNCCGSFRWRPCVQYVVSVSRGPSAEVCVCFLCNGRGVAL